MDSTVFAAIVIAAASTAAILLSRQRVKLLDIGDAELDRLLDAPAGSLDSMEHGVPVIYNLSPAQLDRIRKRTDVQLVDIRQPFEHSQLPPIPGAALIPLMRLRARMRELEAECNTVALCLSGHRSVTAGRTLARNGFRKVFHLKGGMAAWARHAAREVSI